MTKIRKWWWLFGLVALAVILLVLLIISQTQYSNLKSDFETIETQNSSFSNQLTQTQTSLNNLQQEYNDISQQLNDVNVVFPPGEFASSDDLQAWLDTNQVSEMDPTFTYAEWYGRALQLQMDAINDGYIISVDLDFDVELETIFIFCQTVIDGWIWYWDPETDVISQYTYFGPVN